MTSTACRRHEATTWAGFRAASIARTSGALIVVVDGVEGGYDTSGGRWQTICDDHDRICSHDTLSLARSWASSPETWCDACQEKVFKA